MTILESSSPEIMNAHIHATIFMCEQFMVFKGSCRPVKMLHDFRRVKPRTGTILIDLKGGRV